MSTSTSTKYTYYLANENVLKLLPELTDSTVEPPDPTIESRMPSRILSIDESEFLLTDVDSNDGAPSSK